MAAEQDQYWKSRGVPKLPAEVLALDKSRRRAWRRKYVQDLFIPDGLTPEEEKQWRKKNKPGTLTGNHPTISNGIPLRSVPSQPHSASNAQNSPAKPPEARSNAQKPTSQAESPKASKNARKRKPRASQKKPAKVSSTAQEPNISQAQPQPQPILGFTRLCVAPDKQWHNADGSVWQSSDPPSAVKYASNGDNTSNEQSQHTFPQPPSKRQKTGHTMSVPHLSQPARKALTDSQAKSSKAAQRASTLQAKPSSLLGFTRLCVAPKKQWHNADGSVWHLSKPPSAVEHAVNDSTASNAQSRHTNEQPQHTFSQTPPDRKRAGRVIFPPAAERRLSSIPDNLGWTTGEEAFRRMAALVDHSDSELSDSSSDDDEVDMQPVVRGSFAESFADRINEGPPRAVKASPNSQLYATLEEAIVSEEKRASNDQKSPSLAAKVSGELPEFASRPALTTSSGAQQPRDSNTKVQDVISRPDDAKSGDKADVQLGLEKSSSSRLAMKNVPSRFNLEVEESTQEVYEAVEEILEDVCSSTRSLPPSTSTTPEPEKDPLITIFSSGHGELVLESMNTPQDADVTPDDNDAESRSDDSMAEVGEEEGEQDIDGISTGSTSDDSMAEVGEEDGEQDIDGASTGSTSDAGSNIVVAMRNTPEDQEADENEMMKGEQRTRRSSLKLRSSSSVLRELSRFPTPPTHAVKLQVSVSTRPTSQTKRQSQADMLEAPPASPRVIVTRLPDSRRKVTGITSKHFSKSKTLELALETPRRSSRAVAKNGYQLDTQVSSQTPLKSHVPSTFANDFDDEEIRVAPRRNSPRLETPPKDVQNGVEEGAQKSTPRHTQLKPWTASPSKQRIAYVDITGRESRELISDPMDLPLSLPNGYVDLTGETMGLQVPVPPTSPLNADDEPLDYLAKLLKSPNFVKREEPLQAIVSIAQHVQAANGEDTEVLNTTTPKRTSRTPKKTTGTKSPHFITDRVDLYNTTSSSRHVPAGTSTVPIPPLTSSTFGIIQEKLWQEPFWLLIAVTFLNKTTGRAAVPIFWKVKKRFPTPEDLATADPEVLLEMVKTLGLQNARSKRLISMANAWVANPPVKGTAFRTLNYPAQGDGRAREVPDVVMEEDVEICKGKLEIGRIPGCGAYAYDSWRIFCRDVFRGVAEDYNGKGAKAAVVVGREAEEGDSGEFEAEWKRVLPGDKELRACLRWMWMREGWVWDPLTGAKRAASSEELEMAKKGGICIEDGGERKFAKMAVGAEVSSPVKGEDGGDVPY